MRRIFSPANRYEAWHAMFSFTFSQHFCKLYIVLLCQNLNLTLQCILILFFPIHSISPFTCSIGFSLIFLEGRLPHVQKAHFITDSHDLSPILYLKIHCDIPDKNHQMCRLNKEMAICPLKQSLQGQCDKTFRLCDCDK